jgi:hypothetical protein
MPRAAKNKTKQIVTPPDLQVPKARQFLGGKTECLYAHHLQSLGKGRIQTRIQWLGTQRRQTPHGACVRGQAAQIPMHGLVECRPSSTSVVGAARRLHTLRVCEHSYHGSSTIRRPRVYMAGLVSVKRCCQAVVQLPTATPGGMLPHSK